MKAGDTITWMAVNGPKTGVIEGKTEKGYIARLGNGKRVIVHKNSIKCLTGI